MKKLAALLIGFLLVAAMFMGFVPPNPAECGAFHPHMDQFNNDPAEVLKVMDWLIQKGGFNAWQDGARIVLQFRYAGKLGFSAFGTENPTMFFPDNGIDYIRQNTQGLKKVESLKNLASITSHLHSCRNAFARRYNLAEVPLQVPQPVPAQEAAKISLESLMPLALLALLAVVVVGFGALTFGRRLAMG